MTRLGARFVIAVLSTMVVVASVHAQLVRKLGEFDLLMRGIAATVEPLRVTAPRNIPSGVRVIVSSGGKTLTAAEVGALLGPEFRVEGELSGPSLRETITLPAPSTPVADPLLLPIPALSSSGLYTLSNLRIVAGGRTALDVQPQRIDVEIVEQILVTSVTTKPLTLAEIQARGIVLDKDSYLGFQFTMAMTLESKPVEISFPVIFDKRGVAIPQPLEPPISPTRENAMPLPTIVPMLLKIGDQPEPTVRLPNGQDVEVRIPSVLVIPGNVGYLKQFFSAQLFVANGAPGTSGLVVRDVSGTIKLPAGADLVSGTQDDPLSLPATVKGPQAKTLAVSAPGPDGAVGTGDDVSTLRPAEQGSAEFLIRGEREGFHNLSFDINAVLEGMATGPVNVTGTALGGVLVRNPYFDMTFTVPTTARRGEPFKVYVTVNNISQSLANDVRVTIDGSRLSGARLVGDATKSIPTLAGRDAKTLEFTFLSERTGQIVANYLRLDTQNGSSGDLSFTLSVGERGIALSPDTLVLPAAVDNLPPTVVEAAMRVLGQAWSIANAPSGTLPATVTRIGKTAAMQKALALAEAGLRVGLGQPVDDAVRDLLFDFHGGSSLDHGFDQLLRETDAGRGFARAIGAALKQRMELAGGATAYERETAQLAASGADFITFSVANGSSGAPVKVTLTDGSGGHSSTHDRNVFEHSHLHGSALVPLGTATPSAYLGVVTAPAAFPYVLSLTGTATGTTDVAVTFVRAGTIVRGWVTGVPVINGGRYRVAMNADRNALDLESDAGGDGVYETRQAMSTETLLPQGPRLISATVVGPETLASAAPFGQQMAVLFDRVVNGQSAATIANYKMPANEVFSAKRQLSGRLVFASIVRPEGPYMPTTLTVAGVTDGRGVVTPGGTVTLQSRLTDPGAVVSGRVIHADGTAARTAVVTYIQNSILDCAPPLDETVALTAVPVSDDGRFELRYVRQDACGIPFVLSTRDPATGALRQVTSSVRAAGEQIVLDIALFGKGTVTGVVKNVAGQPVPAATVVAMSDTDAQTGGSATTNASGVYSISGVAVGTVRVTAASGPSVGRATGRLDRAGTTTTVNVTLDGGSVTASGTVYRAQNGVNMVLPGVQVVFYAKDAGTFVPVAVTQTSPAGTYRFTGMPTGEYRLLAEINTRDRGEATGVAAAGQNIARDLIVDVRGGLGTVRGTVVMANGSPAAGVVVSIDDRGAVTGPDGRFELNDVMARPLVPQSVIARTRDGLRKGRNDVIVNTAGEIVDGVNIVLSGLGSAEVTVLDANRNPVVDQEVALLGDCPNPCGCAALQTDNEGRVRFSDLPIGRLSFRATRSSSALIDQAQTSVSISRDGETAFGVIIFGGSGVVTGIVLGPDGNPAMGADLVLRSKILNEDSCILVAGDSHRLRTDETGRFRFTNVNIGSVSVTATHPFFPAAAGQQGTLTASGSQLDFTLRLTNTIAGELSGTVLLPDGVTPAGAGVEVTARGALPEVIVATDAQGHYAFAKIFPQGSYTITVRDPVTGGVAQETIFLRASQDLHHDLRLKGRGRVRVRVADGADAAVHKAVVRLTELEFPNRTYEGVLEPSNLGVMEFDGVFEGRIAADASDAFARGGRTASILPRPGDVVDLEVTLTTTGKVRGRFLRPDGTTPIPFGTVSLLVGGRVIGQTTTAGTGEVGTFAFDYVPAGAVRLEAQDPLTARTGFAVGTIAAEGETVALDVLAQGLGAVSGIVTSNGVPQPLAHVDLVSGSYKACAVADGAGSYLIEGVPEGRVVATASLDGSFLSGTTSATFTGDGSTLTLNVALRSSGGVTGQVLRADAQTAAPLSVVTIQVGGVGGGTLSTTTDSTGRYAFERVPAGLATLNAEVAGGADKGRATADVPGGATIDVAIVLNGVGAVNGRALDSAGNATAGDLTFTGTGAFPFTNVLRLGNDGVFNLREVPAGPFTATLRTQSGEFVLYGTVTGAVVSGVTTDVVLQLQPSGSVTGTVKRADGVTPAYGASVTIQLEPNRGTVTLQTSNDGTFTARGVPLGAFSLRVNDPLTAGVGAVNGLNLGGNGDTVPAGVIVLDDSPVAVLSVDPADGANGVAIDKQIAITFSDALQSLAGISVKNGTAQLGLAGALSGDGKKVTLTGTLPDSAELVVTVTTAATDLFGRHPLQTFQSRFRTVDLSPPAVTGVTPAHEAIQVDGGAAITATFSEPLADATDLTTLIVLTSTTGPVGGTVAKTGPSAVKFTPAAALAANTRYTLTINGAVDASGNRQMSPVTSTFATTDTIAPLMILAQPDNGAWINSARPVIQINVADALSGIAIATATLSIDGAAVTQTGTTRIEYTPAASLAEGQHTITAAIADRAANSATLSGGFSIDTVSPGPATITGVTNGQVVSGNITIAATATDDGSGVARIQFAADGAVFATTDGTLSTLVDTKRFSEGSHQLTARAVDQAGNIGPAGAPVLVTVNNSPMTIAIVSPAANQRFRDSVIVKAIVSESALKVDFKRGDEMISDATAPYEATFDLAASAEGAITITATATGHAGESSTAAVSIIVDRTPPAAPDASKINAEPPADGRSLVFGRAGAVEASASVEIVNLNNSKSVTIVAGVDGGFSVYLDGAIDDVLSIVAIDAVANRSAATSIRVRTTPSLPPATGATSLRYEGSIGDRVGLASGSLVSDGRPDAVFTMNLSTGEGVTRTLASIDLVSAFATRSTRGGFAPIGVAADIGSALLNAPSGSVTLPVTGGTSLTLFVADEGFIVGEQTYTVTAVFTDGSRFVGFVTVEEAADHHRVPHSVRIAANPPTVRVAAGVPGTTILTISDIRDIEGTLVPDHSHVAISAADMATKDPLGRQIRSAGGTIIDGTPAANNAQFRVFEVVGGQVTATYSSGTMMPAAILGATATLQVIAADEKKNVIGTEAIGSIDINVKAATDQVTIDVVPATLYADRFDRRSTITFHVRDAAGNPAPNGTRILASINSCASLFSNNTCVSSTTTGQLLGGEDAGAYRRYTVTNGVAQAAYSSSGASVATGEVATVRVQVVPTDANGNRLNAYAIGTSAITLVSAGFMEMYAVPDMVPYVSPPASPLQVIARHAHDIRGNLVPDGANILITVQDCASLFLNNTCVSSAGGTIVDGIPWTSNPTHKIFSLGLGEIRATYSTEGAQATASAQTRITTVQALMADAAGARISPFNIGRTSIRIVGPFIARGFADQSTLFGDGAVHTTNVTFTHILDAFGNPLPDGTKMVVTAADCHTLFSNNSCVSSAGGQITNGIDSPTSGFKVFTIQNGKITVGYANQGIIVAPGQFREARIALAQAGANGERLTTLVLGYVPISIAGMTSTQAAIAPAVLPADGGNYRAVATFTNFRDSSGALVPDGTKVAVTAGDCLTLFNNGACVASVGGAIMNGTPAAFDSRFSIFTIANGQVVVEYSTAGIVVSSGERIATLSAMAVDANGYRIGSNARTLGTVTVRLLAPASATVSTSPIDVSATGVNQLSQIRVTNIKFADGVTLMPDGSKIGLSVADCSSLQSNGACNASIGGLITATGTMPGDGTVSTNNPHFKVFTVSGGEVNAVYSTNGLYAGLNQTLTATVQVVPASQTGSILGSPLRSLGTAVVRLHGTTSAVASGPATLSRSGGATATVTFSGIKNTAGQPVPDGTVVLAAAADCVSLQQNGACNSSAGGQIVDGTSSPSGGPWKAFTVIGGAVTMTYSPTGASAANTVRVQLVPGRVDGTLLPGNPLRSLIGGVWTLTLQ